MSRRILSRTVIILSLVSLFTDISSEMLYPVMPLFLQSIGFSAVWIGFLEGTAQVVIGFSTGYFGKLSDQVGARMPFVRAGYLLSALAKPMMIFSSSTGWIFFTRITERLGKGLRTSARDAVLADESEQGDRGKVFGFHRAMDTLGAAIGPVLALIYLQFHPGDYRTLFLIAFGPGILGAGAAFAIREKKKKVKAVTSAGGFFSFLLYWKAASPMYRRIARGLLFFALLNSADSFLFMMSHYQGIADHDMILAYIFYNLVFAFAAYPVGIFADRNGMRNTLVCGLFFFVLVYFGFSRVDSSLMLFFLFGLYGLFGAMTEGISKAWLSQHCEEKDRGTALGFYKSASSLLALASSVLTGFFWQYISPSFSMIWSAVGASFLVVYFLFFLPRKSTH